MSVGSPTALNKTNNITISAWVKPANINNNYQLLVGWGGTGTQGYKMYINSASNQFSIFTAGGEVKGTTSATNGNWYYVAVTIDSAGTTGKVFVNGVQENSGTVSVTAGTGPLTIGKDPSSSAQYFTGQIDEVKIYNYARTQKQIVSDMNAGHPSVGSPVGSPVGYWKFDEGYGTTAHNSGNGGSALTGTLTNMETGVTTSGWQQAGKFGRALAFDGTDDYVNLGTPTALSNLPTNDFTVSAWIYDTQSASSKWGSIIANYNGTTGWLLRTLSDGSGARSLHLQVVYNGGTASNYQSSYGTISQNAWNYVVAVWNSTTKTATLYINGTIPSYQTQTAGAGTYSSDSAVAKVIGTYTGDPANDQEFKGSIDEVKIYPYALTADEVKLDMNRSSSEVLGALSDNSSYQVNAANQEYCVPGDSTSCAAPVGRWDFEEGSGTSVNDSSGNANTGTWNGTGVRHWTPGKIGTAGNFNGTDDYVDMGTSTTLNPTTTLSAGVWAYWTSVPTAGGGGTQLFGRRTAANVGGYTFDWDATAVKLCFYVYTSSWVGACNAVAPATNTWYYYAGTYDGSNVRLYINGVLKDTQAQTGAINAPSANTYAGFNDITATTNAYFSGKLDEIRVFNYARTPAQVAWDYNRGAPVGYWKFDECQGTTAHDSSGNGNSGTITIGATGTQTAAGTCTDGLSTSAWNNGKTGKLNYSLNFDGTDDYVDFGNVLTQTTGNFSFGAWVKTTDTGIQHGIFGMGAWAGSGYRIGVNSGIIEVVVQDTLGHFVDNTGGASIADSNWHHAFVTVDRTNNVFTIYRDGVAVGTSSISSVTGSLTSARHLVAAAITNSDSGGQAQYFNGQIDDVRIYNYALTATQVKNLYNNGGAVKFAPVTGAP